MSPSHGTAAVPARAANLALHFQEVLTAIERLRSNRQAVSDAESFRMHMREELKAAANAARHAGYSTEDIKMATFAVVAFLDESVLNSPNPLFASWPSKPLQEELFGTHMAGEVFFQNLQQLLERSPSAELADVIEVYHLCLLLGYGGRYSGSGRGELRAIMSAAAALIRRIRGQSSELSPEWALPAEAARKVRDPWTRRLTIAAIACLALAILLFVIFKVALGSGASDLRSIVG